MSTTRCELQRFRSVNGVRTLTSAQARCSAISNRRLVCSAHSSHTRFLGQERSSGCNQNHRSFGRFAFSISIAFWYQFFFGVGKNMKQMQQSIEVLRRSVHLTPEGLDEWGNRDQGFLHLSFYLSLVMVIMSVTKQMCKKDYCEHWFICRSSPLMASRLRAIDHLDFLRMSAFCSWVKE